MKTILAFSMITGSLAHAYAVNEVANRTYKCGSRTITFGKGAQTATVGKKSYSVEWGNRGIDADIGGMYFEVEGDDRFLLEGDLCSLKN